MVATIAHDAPAAPPIDGETLREWRTARGLSQARLGALIDIPANTIAKWERGDQPIRHASVLWLALDQLDKLLDQRA